MEDLMVMLLNGLYAPLESREKKMFEGQKIIILYNTSYCE
jgi:hypothetical protein